MQSLHRALRGIAFAAVVALALGSAGAWTHAALAQHGQHGGEASGNAVADHFHRLLDELQLTSDQRETLAEPLGQVYAAMEELHRLHGVIAAELNEEQRARLAALARGMMEGAMHSGDVSHDGGHH